MEGEVMPNLITVAKLSQVPPGTCLAVETEQAAVALFNVDGRLYALDNCCPHAGGPLGEGTLDGRIVECPWHGWRYDVRTGLRPENPQIAVARYEVLVEGDEVKVVLP
jgi:nitrite reductase (NADH) small subunit/3-phenylpropionate/trans-cinnamate dioxygenase ferredoxin subunit